MEKLQVTDAAAAIGTTPKTIRKWFQSGQLIMPTVQAERGEVAQFADFDLCFLYLVFQFVECGAKIREAAALAQVAFEKAGAEPTDDDVLAPWKGKMIIAERKARDWTIGLWDDYDDEVYSLALVFRPHKLFTEVLDRAQALREQRAA